MVNRQLPKKDTTRPTGKSKLKFPPDPEGMNNERSRWAQSAIQAFQIATDTDFDDVLGDLLCDLMHWCDRTTICDGETRIEFNKMLSRARMNYEAETSKDGVQS